MEIVKRANESHKFKVLRPFYWNGKTVEPGEVIEIKELAEQIGLVQRRMVVPVDIPDVGVYIALQPLTLPGLKEKFTAKKLELVELKKEQAIDLMLEGAVIPKSDNQWRPRNAHLKKEGKK